MCRDCGDTLNDLGREIHVAAPGKFHDQWCAVIFCWVMEFYNQAPQQSGPKLLRNLHLAWVKTDPKQRCWRWDIA
jgi:hypothetical protein